MTALLRALSFTSFSSERLKRTLLCWFFRSWATFSRRFCRAAGYDFLGGPGDGTVISASCSGADPRNAECHVRS